jgi:polar amino acid transport system substrate-binding protein
MFETWPGRIWKAPVRPVPLRGMILSITNNFLRLTGTLFALAASFLVTLISPGGVVLAADPEFFDVPFANNQWNIGRRVDDSKLRYCIDRRNPDWELAAEIVDAVAGALLLEPQRYIVKSEIVGEDLTKTYALLLEHCDILMGFKLIPGTYADWITLTRPYYHAKYTYVTADPDLLTLATLAPTRAIGPIMGTSAHIRLVSYVKALPAEARWPIYPMGTSELMLESLLNGTIDVGLIWAPTFWAKHPQDPAYAALHVIDSTPLPATTLGVGALLLSDKVFLRTAFDMAVTSLIEDGTITDIIDKFNFPATVNP